MGAGPLAPGSCFGGGEQVPFGVFSLTGTVGGVEHIQVGIAAEVGKRVVRTGVGGVCHRRVVSAEAYADVGDEVR